MPEQFPGIGDRSGLGERPAVIVVDMSVGFTSSESPLGADLDDTVAAIATVLEAARRGGVPVVYTTVVYGERERITARAMLRKWPAAFVCEPGSRWVEIDERLAPGEGDPVFEKVFPSAFFGTCLQTHLSALGCDSVVVTGASTSGCVRATAVDAISHGFTVVVPREAVGDRSAPAHRQNLVDLDMKYGDVLPVAEVNAWLAGATVA
ncbi:MAG: isochorismatase family protein [Solirubrobacterales bacterium]